MALSEAEFDRIEAFLEGSLSPDEHRQMEVDMARDHDLQQAVDEHRVIWESLQVPVAVEYFQEMHGQLDEQGLLQFDDIWVEAAHPDDTSAEHPTHPGEHHEPEVFVADEPRTVSDDTGHHIDVAAEDEPVSHPDVDYGNHHADWIDPSHFEPPSHFDGSDDFL